MRSLEKNLAIGIAKLIRDCHLYNIMDIPDQDPNNQLKDTYHWGSNHRIDYVLATAHLRNCVQQFSVLEYNDGIISDHRGLYVNFDPKAASLWR
jgi:endonuclease/exonuclease/phosphatase family metal-dependent hydrolase